MNNNVVKNYLYNLSYQFLILIIPFIAIPYLSRVLGANNIGIFSYTLSINTYFVLFGTLGISMYGQREIAYYQDNKDKRSIVFYEILFLRLITILLSLGIYYFTVCSIGDYSLYYKILIIELLSNCIDISWFFQGLEEFKKTVLRNSFVKIISVLLIFVFVKSSNDLKIYFYIYTISNLLGNLSLWFYLPKRITKINFKNINIVKHIKPVFGLFIPQIAIQIYTVLDKTMIGTIISDKSEVGFYDQAQKIIKFLLVIATSLGSVMIPRIANIYSKGETNKIKESLLKSMNFIMLLVFPLMFGVASIAKHFVPLYFGPGYEKVIYLLIIISPIIPAIGLSNLIGIQYLLPTKQQNKFTISVIIGSVINFTLNMILIRLYKSIGASIATVIAEWTVSIIQIYIVKDFIRFSEIINISYKYIISSVVMFIVSICISIIINNNVYSLIIQILVSIIIYFALLSVLKDDYYLEKRKKIMQKILKKR